MLALILTLFMVEHQQRKQQQLFTRIRAAI